MSNLNMMAIDLGASNGRAVCGAFDGKKIEIDEIHRFSNDYVELNGELYWDILRLFLDIKTGISKHKHNSKHSISSIGIDSWGVDYGLIDKRGQLISNPRSYRSASDEEMNAVFKIVPKKEIFNATGIATLNFNTIFQLYKRKQQNDPALACADKMLMIPDLLGYFLTGEKACEYTEATTTMLYNTSTQNWDFDIIKRLGLDSNLFPKIQKSNTHRGQILSSITNELGVSPINFIAVGEHDTASAVAAVPAKGDDFAFLSSGTWSLFGTESEKSILSDAVFNANYSNEGTIQGGVRVLKNIMGLWLIQECKRDWSKRGEEISYDEIVAQSQKAPAFASIIDPNSPEFFSTGNMERKIQAFCEKTHQTIPQSKGEIARCIYESLALKYRWALEKLEQIKGKNISTLHIVGGGIQNKLLNQFAANATGRTVVTGPIEGACIGNLISQAIAAGEIRDIRQGREVVSNSFETVEYFPQDVSNWNEAYQRMISYEN